jgi:hypothetical protein
MLQDGRYVPGILMEYVAKPENKLEEQTEVAQIAFVRLHSSPASHFVNRSFVDKKCSPCCPRPPICWHKPAWLVHGTVDLHALTFLYFGVDLCPYWLFSYFARWSPPRRSEDRRLWRSGGYDVWSRNSAESNQEVVWPSGGVGFLSSVVCNGQHKRTLLIDIWFARDVLRQEHASKYQQYHSQQHTFLLASGPSSDFVVLLKYSINSIGWMPNVSHFLFTFFLSFFEPTFRNSRRYVSWLMLIRNQDTSPSTISGKHSTTIAIWADAVTVRHSVFACFTIAYGHVKI